MGRSESVRHDSTRFLKIVELNEMPAIPSSPNVQGADTGKKKGKTELHVKKSDPVRVVKMWRKLDGKWYLVWSIPDNINDRYNVSGNDGNITTIKPSGGGRFPPHAEVVVEIDSANAQGNSTAIVSAKFK